MARSGRAWVRIARLSDRLPQRPENGQSGRWLNLRATSGRCRDISAAVFDATTAIGPAYQDPGAVGLENKKEALAMG